MTVWRLVLLVGLALAYPAAAAPNILFIAVDDLRPDLGCYGADHMRSPNIDALAARGLLFERAYCQVAVCNPSRASLLSSCRPDTTRVLANNVFFRETLPEVVTLPQHFKANGYTSLSLGKVFHHSEREPGDDAASWSEPAWFHGEPYRHWFTQESMDFIKRLKSLPKKEQPKLLRAPPFEAADQPDDVYPDGQTAARAVETLRRLKAGGRPFFLAVGFVKPHLPFTCPRKYWDLYPPETIKLPDAAPRPKDAPEAAFHNLYELRSYGAVPPTGDISLELALNLIRGYRACVSYMDAQLGRVLAELDRLELRENTIVVLWGDHGYHLGEQSLFTKMTNFELGTRVPLIVFAPGHSTPNSRTKALVELVDLYPTLADLAGLPLPAHLEGQSFAPVLAQPGRPWKAAAFSDYLRTGKPPIRGRSIRTDAWRYTEWHDPSGQPAGVELYHYTADSTETVNLANDPMHAAKLAELANQLKAGWRQARAAN